MANLSRLALLINDLGGIDEAADLLEIDEDLLQFAVEGGTLSFTDDALISGALTDLILDADAQKEYSLNLQDLFENKAATLDLISQRIEDETDAALWRYAVADGRVTQDDLEKSALLFAQAHMTPAIIDKICTWTADNGNTAKEFLELFELDGFDLREVTDSFFWEWFREVFYDG